MRRSILLACVALLAGCGESEDFTVDVAMSPGQAKAELAQLDGGMALRALGLPLIAADQATQGELSFALPGDEDSGTLRLQFEEVGQNASRIHVSLDLPAQRTTIEGKQMVLSEDKAETALARELQSWASGIAKTGHASLDPLNQALSGMTIALRPGKLNDVLAAAKDPSKLSGLIDPEFMESAQEEQAYAEQAGEAPAIGQPNGAAAPMFDPNAGTADAARPMADTRGIDPNAGIADAARPMADTNGVAPTPVQGTSENY